MKSELGLWAGFAFGLGLCKHHINLLRDYGSHVMTTVAHAMVGIYGSGIKESAYPYMKTRNCVSGCGRVVLSGLC